jgi:type II secretory pathway predicted ATPase ExeA
MISEYVAHFGLREHPFARNQNPKWLYLATQHKEALLKTRWTCNEHGGLVLWRGDVGLGKSSMIEYVMTVWPKQLGWKCAKLQNTGSIAGPHTLLNEVLAAFGLEPASTTRKMVSQLEEFLLEQTINGVPNTVLIIDEAQSIGSKAYPVIRDLINLQTREQILLNIVLAGQLGIDRKLKGFPALRSRIATVATLQPMTYDESDSMLLHRLETSGAYDPFKIYYPRAIRACYEFSQGVPRNFITIADASMKEAFLRDSPRIEDFHVFQAIKGLEGRHDSEQTLEQGFIPTEGSLPSFNRAAAASVKEMCAFARTA